MKLLVVSPIVLFAIYYGFILWIAFFLLVLRWIKSTLCDMILFAIAFCEVFVYPIVGVKDESEHNA